MGEADFPSPVARSDRHVDLRKICHMFNSASHAPFFLPLKIYSIICESLWHWGFRFGAFYLIIMFLLQMNFHVLVVHELGGKFGEWK